MQQAQLLEHPFCISPEIPLDMKFAATRSADSCRRTALIRGEKIQRLVNLANLLSPMERKIQARLSKTVAVKEPGVKKVWRQWPRKERIK